MSLIEPSMSPELLARLDRIEASLARIADALEGRFNAVAAPVAPKSRSAAPSPNRAPTAPTRPAPTRPAAPRPAPVAAAVSTVAASVASTAAPADVAPASQDADVPAAGEAPQELSEELSVALRTTVTGMFFSVMAETDEEAWEALATHFHPDHILAPRALDHLKAFSWPKLRRGRDRYLDDPTDPNSFRVVRTAVVGTSRGMDAVKVFLRADNGGIAPIILQRESKGGTAWCLTSISL